MTLYQGVAAIMAPLAAWYLQYLVRWAGGPFGILDSIRKAVFGVVVLRGRDDTYYHQPIRSHFSGIALLECSRCTLFWVCWPVLALVIFYPWVIIALGIAGGASLLDDIAG